MVARASRVLIFVLVGGILFFLLPSSPLVGLADLAPNHLRDRLRPGAHQVVEHVPWLEPERVVEIPDLSHLRVAVVEQSYYHDEVIGAVLTVMKDLEIEPAFYRHQFYAGFGEVISDVWDADTNVPLRPSNLAGDIQAGLYDVLVLITCDRKFWGQHQAAVEAWIARKDLRIICLIHEVEYYARDIQNSRADMLVPAKEGRLTIGTLSDHGAKAMQQAMRYYETEYGETQWRSVDIFHFAPVFELAKHLAADARPDDKVSPSAISTASILGRMNPRNRGYDRIFQDLKNALIEDPAVWGYTAQLAVPVVERANVTTDDGTGGSSDAKALRKRRVKQSALDSTDASLQGTWVFAPMKKSPLPPFKLRLIGKDEGKLHIPPELVNSEGDSKAIIEIYSNGNYPQFYQSISEVDLILPAFSDDLYFTHRASAAVPASVIAGTPILADPELTTAYPYLGGPAVVKQPRGKSEIQAIAAMRREAMRTIAANTRSSVSEQMALRLEERLREQQQWDRYRQDLKLDNIEAWAAVFVSVQDVRPVRA